MLLYWILPFAAIGAGVPLCSGKSRAGRAAYCVLASAVLFVVGAVRWFVGYDYASYANFYNALKLQNFDNMSESEFEKGFSTVFKLISDYVADYQVVFIVTSLAVAVMLGIYIFKKSSVPWISVTAFLIFGLFFNSMNFTRQMIAALIVAFAIEYAANKRFWRFLVLVLFASAFHLSALIMLPFYFLLRIKMDRFSVPVLSILSVLLFVFSEQLMNFITGIVYVDYAVNNPEMLQGLPPYYTIFFLVFFIFALLTRKMLINVSKRNDFYITAMFFALFFEFIGLKHGVVARMAMFFVIPPALLLSADMFGIGKELLERTFKDNASLKKAVTGTAAAILLLLSLTYYAVLLDNNSNGVVPYRTVFDAASETEGGG